MFLNSRCKKLRENELVNMCFNTVCGLKGICLLTPKEVGVNLKAGYNGDLTSRQAGSVGGQMVKKMIEAYENGLK